MLGEDKERRMQRVAMGGSKRVVGAGVEAGASAAVGVTGVGSCEAGEEATRLMGSKAVRKPRGGSTVGDWGTKVGGGDVEQERSGMPRGTGLTGTCGAERGVVESRGRVVFAMGGRCCRGGCEDLQLRSMWL